MRMSNPRFRSFPKKPRLTTRESSAKTSHTLFNWTAATFTTPNKLSEYVVHQTHLFFVSYSCVSIELAFFSAFVRALDQCTVVILRAVAVELTVEMSQCYVLLLRSLKCNSPK